jgi:uncharacterized protein YprB with RNaseH-like and TPR domain
MNTYTNHAFPWVLYFDIETYGGLKAHMTEISVFGYKWGHEKIAHVLSGLDFPKEFKKDFTNDKPLLEALSEVWNQADIVVAHYGQKFDRCFLNTRIEKHGLPPLKPVKLIDTWRISKDNLALHSNKLDTLLKFFNAPDQKVELTYEEWRKIQRGDIPTLKKLAAHCHNDVTGLEYVFKKHLMHYTTKLPNYGFFVDKNKRVCPHCGSSNIKKEGFDYTQTAVWQQYVCKDCRKWSRSPMSGKGRIR